MMSVISGTGCPSPSSLDNGKDRKKLRVYDCRFDNQEASEKVLKRSGLDFHDFLRIVHKEFAIPSTENFIMTTTDRMVLDVDNFEELQDGTTLLLLQRVDQVLPVATEERIVFPPHYDTLVQSGMFEYYASEGQNPLPYALADLIDNALSATARNTGVRTIEIQMLFDETLGKPAVIVLDNGCGMTSKQLNNWAVYRLSKFSRENPKYASKQDGYVRPDPVPRSLNSDISYFGVGGKQAVFYIGDSARMITKAASSPDVHELVLSKEEFVRKERNNEDIYSGIIRNRKPGDFSHINQEDERCVRELIAEESGKESFTAVVITGVQPGHITFLKEDFQGWTRHLAHMYHYYLHGVNGNDLRTDSTNSGRPPKIDIQISLRKKSLKCPHVLNLRDVNDDMQTLYINAAADTFEFKASATGLEGMVEGVLRYHPFLYDKETYPEDPIAMWAPLGDDDDCDDEAGVLHQARGKKPIFECFWNGRLIPYTTVSEFDWCARPSKETKVPLECYGRFSGVLFTDDRFQVTTNKLTFVDLELQLRSRDTIFTRCVNGQKQRGNIQKEFTQWLNNCHVKWDKQVKFLGFNGTITRSDVPAKKMQYPWATFTSIEWDGKIYKKGQYMHSRKTNPIFCGTILQFLLYGDHDEDVFATGGQVEVALEPKVLHNQTKIIPISKIDRTATVDHIKTIIDSDLAKFPERLRVDWPEGNPWPVNAERPAGTALGPLRVAILNKKGEPLAKMPAVGQGTGKKLMIELKIVWHGPGGAEEIISLVAQHSPKWSFWFKSIEHLTNLGMYTLNLNTVINESNAPVFGGKQLPFFKLRFKITAGSAERFVIGEVRSALYVGVPFNIPLELMDAHGHRALPPPDLKPELECRGLDLSYEGVDSKGTNFIILGVKAKGKVQNYQCKTYDLKVILPDLKQSQTLRISLLPGEPHSLHVTPEATPTTVENGSPARFNVEIQDEAGNITARPRLIVRCQVPDLPPASINCSTGAGILETGPINLKIMKGESCQLLATFDIPSRKDIAVVVRELTVVPSTKVSRLEIYSKDDENLILRTGEKIEWEAGGLLENLYYKLYDEGNREIRLTAEIASRIKVNWTPDVNLEDLVQGKLPDVHVPKQVKEKRFYQVSYQDQNVSVSFIIAPRPDEPKRLKATLSQNTLRLGETLPGQIILELVDQYDNVTKSLTSACVDHITVEAEGLDRSALSFTWQESSSSVSVTGVHFQSGTPGTREMSFSFKSFVEHIMIKLTAGFPAQLTLTSAPAQPLQVLNDQGIPTPFIIQLCDEWGNPSPDQRVVVGLKPSSSVLKVVTDVTSQPVNTDGKATFTVKSVSGPKGEYQLNFWGSFNKKSILGPSVTLTVIPDPNKPVSLKVDYDTDAKFPAGGTFPVFSVTVVSDEGSSIRGLNPAAVSMLFWKGEAGKMPPQSATEMKCSKPKETEKDDCFHFRDKTIPEHAGKYTVQFRLRINRTTVLFSEQIIINVVANHPVKLAPDFYPPAPVVSNSDVIANRTLVEGMTLRIMDLYDNPADLKVAGKVVVSIRSASGSSDKNLPLFEGKINTFHINLVEGKVHINRLAIMENSPGQDGGAYILLFKPEVSGVPDILACYELHFHFCNDVEKKQKMSELSKKKNELTVAIGAYKEIFATSSELLSLFTAKLQDATKKEAVLRTQLNNKNANLPQRVPSEYITRLIREKTAEANRIWNMSRRVCSISDRFKGQQDVLGMVGHLAYVEDDAVAAIISWHIMGDMDCVITITTAAAMKIFNDTAGRQQVMALDSVRMNPTRPLPHIRNGTNLFDPPGNPVYARDLLIYPQNKENCEIVFKNLLGDTILIDDLGSGNIYRMMVVQNRMQCPTILTRHGERISANGKFGGSQNKAPPIERLHGHVFGAPIPQHYYILNEQIGLLQQYQACLKKKELAKKEYDDHIKKQKSPDMLQKEVEMEEKKKQLEEIERQLASSSVRTPVKRGVEKTGEPSGQTAKRAKQ